MTTITDLLGRLESCYDAIPRVGGARAEDVGPFVLFVREGPGWPYYARPRPATATVTVAEVEALRARQRELGVPEALEWVHDVTPSLLAAAEATGLSVLRAPLMVLDPAALPAPVITPGVTLSLLDPDDPDFTAAFAISSAVANLGFAAEGTGTGTVGPAERDARIPALIPEAVARIADGIRSGRMAEAVAATANEGYVARGALQAAQGAAEIVGVATLPSARRRGLGAAVSALLAREALNSGHELVFLSAASEDVARIYASIGFRRVGTACIAEPPASP